MIEHRGAPAFLRVAFLTVNTVGTTVNVIGPVTGRTILWERQAQSFAVAGRADYFAMPCF